MEKGAIRVGALALAGIVVAGALAVRIGGGESSATERISLASAKRGTVTAYVSAAGSLVDTGIRDLAFGSEGTVEKVYVKAGDKVKAGDVLARIDATIARENYEAAKAALAAAEEILDAVRNGTAGAASSGGTGSGRGSAGGGAGNTGAGGARTGTAGALGDGTGSGTVGAGRGTAAPECASTPTPAPRPSPRPSGGLRPAAVSLSAAIGGESARAGGPIPSPTGDGGRRAPVKARHRMPTSTAAPQVTVSASVLPTTGADDGASTPRPSPTPESGCADRDEQGRGAADRTRSGRTQSSPAPNGGAGQGSAGRGGAGHIGSGQGRQGAAQGQGGRAVLTEAQAEAEVSQAKSDLAEAKEALAGVRIKAPADGTILSISGTVGSHYRGGTFITLGNLDDLQVQAMFTQSDIRFLKLGQKAVVTFPVRAGEEYSGTVVHIDPMATTSDRLVRYGVTIALDHQPPGLLLGQSAAVRVTTDQADDALYVPAQAVRTLSDGSTVVTVLHDGAQARRTVKIGVRGDQYVQIVEGLSDGDRVVLPTVGADFPDEGFPGMPPSPTPQ